MTPDETPEVTAGGAPDPAAPALNLSAGEVAALAAAVDAGRARNTFVNYRSAWTAWQAWADERGAAGPARPPGPRRRLPGPQGGAGCQDVDRAPGRSRHRRRPPRKQSRQPLPVATGQGGRQGPGAPGRAGRQGRAEAGGGADEGSPGRHPRHGLQPPYGSRRTHGVGRRAALRRGLVDIALCSVMSDAGLRRSEASALLWADVDKAEDGSGRLTIRHSKTDKEGEGAVVAITAAPWRTSRPCAPAPPTRTPCSGWASSR